MEGSNGELIPTHDKKEKPENILGQTREIIPFLRQEEINRASPFEEGSEGVREKLQKTGLSEMRIEEILGNPQIQQQMENLRVERKTLTKTVRQKLSRAILPLLVLSGAESANANETPQDEKNPVVLVQEPEESDEEEIEVAPRLYSEHIPPREWTKSEQRLFQSMREEVLTNENEVFFFALRDEKGKIKTIKKQETGPMGGRVSVPSDIAGKGSVIAGHTHPLAVTERKEYQEEFGLKAGGYFSMPPSIVDISAACTEERERVNRVESFFVTDPKGIWEYRCREDGPMMTLQKKMYAELPRLIDIVQTLDLSEDLKARIDERMRDKHPTEMVIILKEEIAAFDPVKAAELEALINNATSFDKFEEEMALIADYIVDGNELLGVSAQTEEIKDPELLESIDKVIKSADRAGIYLSYTPFQE